MYAVCMMEPSAMGMIPLGSTPFMMPFADTVGMRDKWKPGYPVCHTRAVNTPATTEPYTSDEPYLLEGEGDTP